MGQVLFYVESSKSGVRTPRVSWPPPFTVSAPWRCPSSATVPVSAERTSEAFFTLATGARERLRPTIAPPRSRCPSSHQQCAGVHGAFPRAVEHDSSICWCVCTCMCLRVYSYVRAKQWALSPSLGYTPSSFLHSVSFSVPSLRPHPWAQPPPRFVWVLSFLVGKDGSRNSYEVLR